MTKFNLSDFRVGMVVVTENGNKYAVCSITSTVDVLNVYDADSGKATACSNYLTLVDGKLAVAGGNTKGGRIVKEVYDFIGAVPTRNKLSEAVKIAIKRPASYTMKKVWDNSADKVITKDDLKKIIETICKEVVKAIG